MKMKKSKVLLTLMCAVALVATSVFGTLAYLTSEDTVVNTFTVGNVAIKLDELDVDNSTEGENDRDQANAYHLLPGQNYVKDPTIHVSDDSEACFLFVKVDNGIAAIETKEQGKTIADQMAALNWVKVEGEENVYVLDKGGKYEYTVFKGANAVVFEEFTIDGSVTNKQIEDYANEQIVVTAYAVQAAGFDNALEAWEATFGAPATA